MSNATISRQDRVAAVSALEMEVTDEVAQWARDGGPAMYRPLEMVAQAIANARREGRAEAGTPTDFPEPSPMPMIDMPLDAVDLPDYWDARRLRLGKPDKSVCGAELRLALAWRGLPPRK